MQYVHMNNNRTFATNFQFVFKINNCIMNILVMILLLFPFSFLNNGTIDYAINQPPALFCESPIPYGNEIDCLIGTYKSTWKGKTIVVEIVDARYNNFLSFKGVLSGYIKYNGKTYPMTGTLHLNAKERRYSVYMNMSKYDSQNNICFDFDGYITCYTDGSGKFSGAIITPGYIHPERNEFTLTKKVDSGAR